MAAGRMRPSAAFNSRAPPVHSLRPETQHLLDLVGALSVRSEEFRTLWGSHDVRRHYSGAKHFHHPAVGPLATWAVTEHIAEIARDPHARQHMPIV